MATHQEKTLNFEKEWDYRYQERIGLLCEPTEKRPDGSWILPDPTPAQRRVAREEAYAAIAGFRDQLKLAEAFAAD
jgi:hypothetical protein